MEAKLIDLVLNLDTKDAITIIKLWNVALIQGFCDNPHDFTNCNDFYNELISDLHTISNNDSRMEIKNFCIDTIKKMQP